MNENTPSESSLANKKNHLVWCLVLAIYWMLFFTATHLPKVSEQLPQWGLFQIPHFDKIIHFSGYCILSLLVVVILSRWRVQRSKRLMAVFILMLLYATFDEVTQQFVEGRTPDFYDWIADLLGSLTGLVIYVKLENGILKKKTVTALDSKKQQENPVQNI